MADNQMGRGQRGFSSTRTAEPEWERTTNSPFHPDHPGPPEPEVTPVEGVDLLSVTTRGGLSFTVARGCRHWAPKGACRFGCHV